MAGMGRFWKTVEIKVDDCRRVKSKSYSIGRNKIKTAKGEILAMDNNNYQALKRRIKLHKGYPLFIADLKKNILYTPEYSLGAHSHFANDLQSVGIKLLEKKNEEMRLKENYVAFIIGEKEQSIGKAGSLSIEYQPTISSEQKEKLKALLESFGLVNLNYKNI